MKQVVCAVLLLTVLAIPVFAKEIDYSQENSMISPISFPAGYVPYYNHATAEALARMMYGEGGANVKEHAAACWVVINRVESGYGSPLHVLGAPGQFVGYRKGNPVDPLLYELAKDVLIRWDMERCGYETVGRVLPPEYLWFTGDGTHNIFRDAYRGGNRWDWSLPDPYTD